MEKQTNAFCDMIMRRVHTFVASVTFQLELPKMLSIPLDENK